MRRLGDIARGKEAVLRCLEVICVSEGSGGRSAGLKASLHPILHLFCYKKGALLYGFKMRFSRLSYLCL